MVVPYLVALFVVLLILTVPVAFAAGLATVVALSQQASIPLLVVPHRMFSGTDSFVLLAIPLFILAGSLMEHGGISRRLMELANVLVGHVRGGLAMTVVVATMFFSGTTGSKLAEVSALGSVALPGMERAGYRAEMSVSIVSAASAMGELIPPALLMIVIAELAELSVGKLFLASLVPALLLAAILMLLILVQATRGEIPRAPRPSLKQFARAVGGAVLPLGMPVIIFGAIFGGIADPTESAALAVFYAVVIGLFVYRELKLRDLPRILIDSGVTTGVVLFMVGAASAFSWVLAVQQVPKHLSDILLGITHSPWVFFVLTTVVFIVLGAVLEGLPAVIICLPIFLPIARTMGIGALHYGVVVVAAIGIGLFLPPVGAGYLIACRFAKLRPEDAVMTMIPYLAVLFLGVVVLITVPWFTLMLPNAVSSR